MKKTPIVLATLLLAAVVARGGVGDLSHVACDVKDALKPQSLSYGTSRSTEAPKVSGVVNPKASVLLLRAPGGLVVSVAIDSAKPGAAAPDVVRLDFTGAGKFAKAPSLPLKRTSTGSTSFSAVFGPTAVKVRRGGKTIPVTISGRYFKSRTYRYVTLYLGTAVAGKCAFGETVLPVRIIDGNCSLSCGDRASVVISGGRVRGMQRGDTLEIGSGDDKAPLKYLYGQPVLVKGSWYEVAISSDASKVTAKPLHPEVGKLKVAHENWTCLLAGDKQIHHISGGSAPVTLPTGKYKVIEYAEYTGDEAQASRGKLEWSSFQSSVGPVKVRAGATTELAIGTPLRASTNVGRAGDAVVLNLWLTDAAGAPVRDLYLPSRRRPAPPKVSVLDSSGKRVYQATMEYG